jgi:hypothetical protein
LGFYIFSYFVFATDEKHKETKSKTKISACCRVLLTSGVFLLIRGNETDSNIIFQEALLLIRYFNRFWSDKFSDFAPPDSGPVLQMSLLPIRHFSAYSCTVHTVFQEVILPSRDFPRGPGLEQYIFCTRFWSSFSFAYFKIAGNNG